MRDTMQHQSGLTTHLSISTFSVDVPYEKWYSFRAFQWSEHFRSPIGCIHPIDQWGNRVPAYSNELEGQVTDLMFGMSSYRILRVNYHGICAFPEATAAIIPKLEIEVSVPYDEYVQRGKPQSLSVRLSVS